MIFPIKIQTSRNRFSALPDRKYVLNTSSCNVVDQETMKGQQKRNVSLLRPCQDPLKDQGCLLQSLIFYPTTLLCNENNVLQNYFN